MRKNHRELDITQKSYTFPNLQSTPEIPLDSKIREIQRKFNANNLKIILEGPTFSGKTAHLLQFTQNNNKCCFSYFLSDDYWVLRPTNFLTSLCNQMNFFLGMPPLYSNSAYDSIRVDIEQLKIIFERLSQKVIEVIKEEKITCYFVIDGLEKALAGNPGERIIDLFPLPTHQKGLYFLGSIQSSSAQSLSFDHWSEEPHYFSITETAKYVEDMQLSEEQILKLQDFSGGMPGYLSVVKNIVKNGQTTLDQILNEPTKLEALIDYQWKNILSNICENHKLLLGLLAYSLIPLNRTSISEILDLDVNDVDQFISKSTILKRVNKDCFEFYPNSQKKIAQEQLKNIKNLVVGRMTSYYATHPDDKVSSVLLPEYYRIIDNFQALDKLLTPQYLLNITLENNSLSLAQRNLRHSINLAITRKDLSILKYGIAHSQLGSIENNMIGISEVQALISMGKFDDAIKLAYSSNIITTRVRYLSQVYLSMEKEGITVPRQSINEIKYLVENLDLNEINPETLLNTATDIFPLLPDVATALVDRAKFKESDKSPIELFALMTSVKSEDPDCEDLVAKIKNDDLRDLAIIHSPWLSNLPAAEVIRKSNEANNSKAKEYLLRHWCIQNKKDSEIHRVIEAALNNLISDQEYKVPLRNLRQLTEPLKNTNPVYRELLIKRFENPIFTNIRSPIQEFVRLKLNLVEALYEIRPNVALDKLKDIYSLVVMEPMDIDIFCYCLARLWITTKLIDPNDNLQILEEIKKKLEDAFINLLETSAFQLDVAKRVLRSIALVDPKLALAFSEMLNTLDRRDIGIQEVLTAYIRQDIKNISAEIITLGLDRINDKRIREQTLIRLVIISKELGHFTNTAFKSFLIGLNRSLDDPLIKAKCSAHILSTFEKDNLLCNDVFYLMLDSWEKIDIVWMKVECGFDLASIIAKNQEAFAEELLDKAKALRKTSSLANQQIGIMYFETLKIASRVAGNLDFSDASSKDAWEKLIQSIELIPSNLLRISVISQLAITRLRVGDKNSFDELIQEKIIPALQLSPWSDLYCSVISDLALPIFEYSPEEARSLVGKLPYSLQNSTWVKVAIRILSQSNVCDPFDEEPPIGSLDQVMANKILRILEFTERDHEISQIIHLLCYSITNDNCKLKENQKLDVLTRLEFITSTKLPDPKNIPHIGYKVISDGNIECARRSNRTH